MIENDALFGENGTYRWALSRKIENPYDSTPTERRLLAVMLNPSKAGGLDSRGQPINDLTIIKCMGFARKWGFGHLRVVNLFALVSTDPVKLLTHPDPVGPQNDIYIDHNARWADNIWLAWGFHYFLASKVGEARVEYVKKLIAAAHKPTFHLGLTRTGHPKHPSRLAYATPRVMEN